MAASLTDRPTPSSSGGWDYVTSTTESRKYGGIGVQASGSPSSADDRTPRRYASGNSIDALSMTRFGLRTTRDRDVFDENDSDGGTTVGSVTVRDDDGTYHSSDAFPDDTPIFDSDSEPGVNDEFRALRKCIATANISLSDRRKAQTLLGKLSNKGIDQFPDIDNDSQGAEGDTGDTPNKLRSLKERLDSLESSMQTEAKARAGMWAMYDHAFSLVDHDMYVIRTNVDRLAVERQECAVSPTMASFDQPAVVEKTMDELQAMIDAAVEKKIDSLQPMNDVAAEERIGRLQATVDEEQKRRAALSELVNGKLQNQVEALQDRNAEIITQQAVSAIKLKEIREAIEVERQKIGKCAEDTAASTVDLRKTLNSLENGMAKLQVDIGTLKQGPTSATIGDIEERLDAMDKYGITADQRSINGHLYSLQKSVTKLEMQPTSYQQALSAAVIADVQCRVQLLEEPASGTVQNQLQELRFTTTAFDGEVKRATSRIAQLEKDVSNDLMDRRLTDAELHLQDLENSHPGLVPSVRAPAVRNHVSDCVATTASDIEIQKVQRRLLTLESGSYVHQLNEERLETMEADVKDVKTRHSNLVKVNAGHRSTQDTAIERLRQSMEALPSRLGDIDLEDLYVRLEYAGDFDAKILERLDGIEARLEIPAAAATNGRPGFLPSAGVRGRGRGRGGVGDGDAWARGSGRGPGRGRGRGRGRGGYVDYEEKTAAEMASGPDAAIGR